MTFDRPYHPNNTDDDKRQTQHLSCAKRYLPGIVGLFGFGVFKQKTHGEHHKEKQPGKESGSESRTELFVQYYKNCKDRQVREGFIELNRMAGKQINTLKDDRPWQISLLTEYLGVEEV